MNLNMTVRESGGEIISVALGDHYPDLTTGDLVTVGTIWDLPAEIDEVIVPVSPGNGDSSMAIENIRGPQVNKNWEIETVDGTKFTCNVPRSGPPFPPCPHVRHVTLLGKLMLRRQNAYSDLARIACEVLLEDIGYRLHPLRKESECPASEPMLLRAMRKDSEWHRFGPEADRGDREYRISACHWVFRAIGHLSEQEDTRAQGVLFDAGVELLAEIVRIETA